MENSLFYNDIQENNLNRQVVELLRQFTIDNPTQQLYLISSPLGEKYKYSYEENAIVILSPRHKLIFLDLKNDKSAFEQYYEDFIEDLSAISDKFEYKAYIGRPRDWKASNTECITIDDFDINRIFKDYTVQNDLQRKSELLISLLIGSINDIKKVGANVPDTLLDKVRKNILLLDGDQTRFIYRDFSNKTVAIQGLSGTGKTELLLHKLKELYLSDDKCKIFFTCHNIALANTLKERVPVFFDFMKVEKQIEWNSRLWVNRAWGSGKDKDSGLYTYICHFYGIPFLVFNNISYEYIFRQALEQINQIPIDKFEFAFDYLLIDERQDFPNVFFELCEKIARKRVYIAGDIFQKIYENSTEIELNVDVILNRCYRTDPRTLMFAHAVGMGLFEKKKLNWFEDRYWSAIGYDIKRLEGNVVHLSREPIRRFEELEPESFESVIIETSTKVSGVIDILKRIKSQNENVNADDIAIIVLDDGQKVFSYIDSLYFQINKELGWSVNRAIENKIKKKNEIYITNSNNVKGLEFLFVICITNSIQNSYRYRNILYTMLTRSFIQSYLLITDSKGIESMLDGLKTINRDRLISTIEPSVSEKKEIENTLIKIKRESNISYKEFLDNIFRELNIKVNCRGKFEKALMQTDIEKFDLENTKKFIETNKEFYCK